MKKTIKIIIILIIFISTLTFQKSVYATEVEGTDAGGGGSTSTQETTDSGKLSDILKQADSFVNKGKETSKDKDTIGIDESKLKKNMAKIFNMLSTVGMILSVAVGGILGIKFMMASAEDKAQIKEMMIPYIIGCVVIFGAFAIWKIVVSTLSSVA